MKKRVVLFEAVCLLVGLSSRRHAQTVSDPRLVVWPVNLFRPFDQPTATAWGPADLATVAALSSRRDHPTGGH